MIRPNSQNARLLEVLRRGPATNADIHRDAGHMIVNSRVAELRSHGYGIECEHLAGSGARAFLYTLIADPPLTEPVTEPDRSASGGQARVVGAGSVGGEQLRLEDVAA